MRVNSLEPNEYAFEDSIEVKIDCDFKHQSIIISLKDSFLRPNKLYFNGIVSISLSYGNVDANRLGELADTIVETKVSDKEKKYTIEFMDGSVIEIVCSEFYYEFEKLGVPRHGHKFLPGDKIPINLDNK